MGEFGDVVDDRGHDAIAELLLQCLNFFNFQGQANQEPQPAAMFSNEKPGLVAFRRGRQAPFKSI